MFTSLTGKLPRAISLSLGLIAAFALAAVVIKAEATISSVVRSSREAVVSPVPLSLPQGSSIADIQSELITINRYGIDPRAINRPAGSFMLVLENRSGLQDVLLQLKNESGEVLKEIQLKREDSDWSEVVTLPAGRYSLTEANHEGWNCTFTTTE